MLVTTAYLLSACKIASERLIPSDVVTGYRMDSSDVNPWSVAVVAPRVNKCGTFGLADERGVWCSVRGAQKARGWVVWLLPYR